MGVNAKGRELSALEGVDVLVAGGGNAALCAALTARESGARVAVLERDAIESRGGNSKYTRNVRCAHQGGPHTGGPYPEEELLQDLVNVTGEDIDLAMARYTIKRSVEAPAWMERQGVTWQGALRGTQALTRTNRFFLGGGKALLNTYYRRAEQLGIEVFYNARVEQLQLRDGRFASAAVATDGRRESVAARAIVVASGGFESSLAWLRQYWGDAVDNYIIRGTACNDGTLLAALLDMGAVARGNARGFHSTAVDARSPRYDGGIVTRIDSIPFGIAVNRDARRFYDEGEEIWPKRYAVWGRLIAEQPEQVAFSIFDERAWGSFIPGCYPPFVADTIGELAGKLGLDAETLTATVEEYNRAAVAGEGYDGSRHDGRAATGLEPPKSNWALPVDRPPFRAYPLRPGITFTYLGVGVDRQARVLTQDGSPLPGIYAAGEIMAGNVLLRGYLAGFGMTIGTVFGRIAGEEAAAHARSH
ncbi:MAG: FAD-dependent tricarballylate dehydrogenase TcuA [Candidatus Dormibacteraeota bacterium]|nr:FAD-dependent tricarballylate dehydrogenase TcuA [Candidatus Dormibacteraeota bacterium]